MTTPGSHTRTPVPSRALGRSHPRRPLAAAALAVATLPLLAPLAGPAAHGADRPPTCQGKRATIVGTDRGETLRGTPRADVIVGLGGNDRIMGLGGNDVVCAGGGNDKVDGGAGTDVLLGEAGTDVLDTGTGARDRLLGGSARDVLHARSEMARLEGGSGDDRLVTGYRSLVRVLGGGGNDRVEQASPHAQIDAGPGNDRVVSVESAAEVLGGDGDDVLVGGDGRDNLQGGPGDDDLTGGAGDDAMFGGPGTDYCTGFGGVDYCDGGSPGPEQNTRDDPDECDRSVEEKASCRDDSLPDRFRITASANATDSPHPSEALRSSWSASIVVERTADLGDRQVYTEASGTGSWSIEGTSDRCTVSGAGPMVVADGPAGGLDAYLAVVRAEDPRDDVYELEVKPLDLPPTTVRCPTRTYESTGRLHPGGNLFDLAWDASDNEVTGSSDEIAIEEMTGTWSWTIRPVQED